MPDDPVRAISDALGGMSDRVGDYAAVWKDAAAKNAAESYNADAVIADFLKLSSLVVRDMFTVATSAMKAFGALSQNAASTPEAETSTEA